MKELAKQLEADQEHISKLETEISVRPAAPEAPSPDPSTEYEQQIKELQALKARNYEVRTQIQQRLQKLESESETAVDGLVAYQLVRALLSDPAIRSQYPELLTDLDAYIEEMSRQEQERGMRQGYTEIIELLKTLSGEPQY